MGNAKKYKFKPNKGVLKRIKVTAKGKIKTRHPGGRHLLSHKSGNRRRYLRRAMILSSAERATIREAIGQ